MARLLVFMLCISAHHFKECASFRWEEVGGLQNGSRVVKCSGSAVTFSWQYSLDVGDRLMGLSWSHRPSHTDRETSIGTFGLGKFSAKDPRISKVGEAGIEVADLVVKDSGTFIVYAQLSGALGTESQRAYLLVAEPPITTHGSLRMSVNNFHSEENDDDDEGNNIGDDDDGDDGDDDNYVASIPVSNGPSVVKGDEDLRLMCGHFSHLGTPPVSVVWEDPDGHILPSTSYEEGYFILDLPQGESKGGNYHCLLNLSSEAASCLPASSALRGKAVIEIQKLPAASADTTTSQNKEASMSSGIIVGIILAVLLLAIIIVIVLVFIIWRGRKGKSYAPKEPDSPGPEDESSQPFNSSHLFNKV